MQDNPDADESANRSNSFERSTNPLVRKLESLAPLSAADRASLEAISADPYNVEPRTDLIREGDAPAGVYLIMDGTACRYKVRASGTRQIMAFLIAGDLCDLDVALLTEMDHSIATLSACRVVRIEIQAMTDLINDHPAVARALRLATLVDEATLREWLLNVGRRTSEERIAHLLCELLLRLQAVGRAREGSYELPFLQSDLADTTGLSKVHVNRSLHNLRQRGFIELNGRQLKILDLPRLEQLAEFKSNYLHLGAAAA